MAHDSSRLASRLREVLRSSGRPAADRVKVTEGVALPPGPRYVPEVPGFDSTTARCAVVERRYDAGLLHGPARIGEYASLATCGEALAIMSGGLAEWPTHPLAFFDIETTGLSGGAGTYAFLVGWGRFDGEDFCTTQFFMAGFEAESELLAAVADIAATAGVLVTFNGRAFDVPVMETRYLFHRLESPFASLRHLDMLHPARCLWRRRGHELNPETAGFGFRPTGMARGSSCSLVSLEQELLSFWRVDDIPGDEIPARFFRFLRTGDPAVVEPVFEHNRLDLLSLAALTSLALRLVDGGPDMARSGWECLALGRMYERANLVDLAVRSYERAGGLSGAPLLDRGCTSRPLALRWLACRMRRRRRHDEAARIWEQILAIDGGASPVYQEAVRALAIHHEHRSRDLPAARQYALRVFDVTAADERQAAEHRLARLERKLSRGDAPAPSLLSGSVQGKTTAPDR
jgi:uncharacterized protein